MAKNYICFDFITNQNIFHFINVPGNFRCIVANFKLSLVLFFLVFKMFKPGKQLNYFIPVPLVIQVSMPSFRINEFTKEVVMDLGTNLAEDL